MPNNKFSIERGSNHIPRGLYVHFGINMAPVVYFRKPKWATQQMFDEIMDDIEILLTEAVVDGVVKMASDLQS